MSDNPPATARVHRGAKHDVRPIGAREHYTGIGILSLVMLICTWVLIRGLAPKGVLWGAYDPSLFGGQATAAQLAPAEPTAEVTDTAGYGAEAGDWGEETGAQATAAGGGERPAPRFLPVELPGWQGSAVETFSADNLYEKINGRAESFTPYEVQGLEFQTFAGPGGAGLDLFIYDMSKPLNAFGKYGSERSDGDRLPDLGQDAYQAAGSVFCWQDKYYLQIVAGTGSEAEAKGARELAALVVAKLPAGRADIPGLKAFPAQDLKPGSVGYVLKGALGQEWLNDIYTATYVVGETEVSVFLALREEAAQAEEEARRYREFLATCGTLSDVKVDGQELTICDQNGVYDLLFRRGKVFGGVSYNDNRAASETIAARLAKAQ